MTDFLSEFVEGGLRLWMLLHVFRQRFQPNDDFPLPFHIGGPQQPRARAQIKPLSD
jgi:hypothetical protein